MSCIFTQKFLELRALSSQVSLGKDKDSVLHYTTRRAGAKIITMSSVFFPIIHPL